MAEKSPEQHSAETAAQLGSPEARSAAYNTPQAPSPQPVNPDPGPVTVAEIAQVQAAAAQSASPVEPTPTGDSSSSAVVTPPPAPDSPPASGDAPGVTPPHSDFGSSADDSGKTKAKKSKF